MKGLDDFFVLDEENVGREVERARDIFKQTTRDEPTAVFFMNIQLSKESEENPQQKLIDFKKLFLFTKKFVMSKETHSTEQGIFVSIKNRVVSLTIDEPQDHLSVNFVLDDGKSITLRTFGKYRSFLHDVILKDYLAPNLKS